MKITSSSNPRVKEAAKLREARERVRQGRIIIDGVREIGRALDAGVKILEVFISDEPCREMRCGELLEKLAAADVLRLDVAPAVFEKLAFGKRDEGIVATAETPQRSLDQLQLP